MKNHQQVTDNAASKTITSVVHICSRGEKVNTNLFILVQYFVHFIKAQSVPWEERNINHQKEGSISFCLPSVYLYMIFTIKLIFLKGLDQNLVEHIF